MKKKLWLIVAAVMLFSVFSVPVTASAATVKLNKKSITIEVKEKYTLKVKGTSKKVKWTSNNKKIATVTSKGVVKGVKKGSCKITAKVGKKKLVCKVTVKKPAKKVAVKSIKLSNSRLTLKEGAKKTLKVKYTPSKANTGKKITWKSSDKKVATVSSKGVVTAKGKGTATITAKTANGKTAKCKVTVEVNLVEIAITNDNVNEYFEVKEIFEWHENAFGEIGELWWTYQVCIKDKYADRLVDKGEGSEIAFEYEWDNKEFYPMIDYENKTYAFNEASEPTPENEATNWIVDGYGFKKMGEYWAVATGGDKYTSLSKDGDYSDDFTVTRRVNLRITRAEGTLVLRK